MVGSAICRKLESVGVSEIATASSSEVDLRKADATFTFVSENQPDIIIVAAAKVGGILANSGFPADFAYDNLMIAANTIHAAHRCNTKKLLFLGSSCIYPKLADQPIAEEALLTGSLEPTNEAYAVAKIAGVKLCQYYRQQYGHLFHSAMPCNLYGPGDNYDPDHSHVIPGLIRRFHEAKIQGDSKVEIWGTGTARREFLFSEDLAESIVKLLEHPDPPNLINIGSGSDITIRELAKNIAKTIGFTGQIIYDKSKPDGTPRKLMDSTKIRATGWAPQTSLKAGLAKSYQDFLKQFNAEHDE